MAAFKPDQPISPATSVVAADVIITWDAPSENGSPITGYRVTIGQSDLTFSQEMTYCDGSKPAIKENRICTIPLSVLTAAPFSLTLGDSVYAKVVAINHYGDSVESDAANGATVLLVPNAPVSLADNALVTSKTVIGLTWNNGISTGGSPIIDYRVFYDQSTGDYIELDSGITLKSYETTVLLTPGAIYNFKVEARNSVGYSLQSDALAILCA